MIKIKDLDIPEITAGKIRDEFVLYESSSSEFRSQMAEDEDFYLGNQLTDAQKEYLQGVGQPAESNNKIRPAVEQVLANIAAASPEWDVEPVGANDNRVAAIYNTILQKIWKDSDCDVMFRKSCKDFIIKGLTYMYIYEDYDADGGMGGLKVKRFAPEAVFVDPNSIQPDFSDASSIIYSDLHTKEHIKVAFPRMADKIDDLETDHDRNEETSGNYSRDSLESRGVLSDDHQDKVRKYIHFSKVAVPMVKVYNQQDGSEKVLSKEEYEKFSENPEYENALNQGLFTEEIIYQTKIREICCFADYIYYDELRNIEDYPIIPACNEHIGTPYPAGDVRHAKSPQRMLNRTEALLIAHTNATANFKLVVEDGAIEPKELAKWNIPNAIIRANPGALREQKIKEFAPPAVSSQLYSEKQRYELDIEQVFGAYKYLQGMANEGPGTVGEAQIVDEAVSRKQNWKILPLYDMLTRMARVAVQWMPEVYSQPRILRMHDTFGGPQEVAINQPQQDPITGEISRIYDMMTMRCDIRVIVGSAGAKSPMQELQKNIELMNVGIYDKSEVIQRMPGDVDKQGLLQRHSEISQLTGQVEQLTAQIKKLTGDLQTRERELFHSNMRAEISEATKPVAQAVSNIRATAKVEQEKQRAKTTKVTEDLAEVNNSINSLNQGAPNQGNSIQ